MNVGYIFRREQSALEKCLQKKYACSTFEVEQTRQVELGAIIFRFNPKTDTLIGPFTSRDSSASKLEQGAWRSKVDEEDVSENVALEWVTLHILENASEQYAIVQDLLVCKLSAVETRNLLDALAKAPLYMPS